MGVGLNIGYVGGSLPKQENVSYDKGDYSGLFRLTFDAGYDSISSIDEKMLSRC